MDPTISVVVVNWNSGAHLRSNLDALFAHMPATEWDVVVVDNHSSDGSERFALGHGTRCGLIRNGRNLGFGAGVNRGVSSTSGRYVLVLNPDCLIGPGTVDGLAAVLARHDDCAVAGPRMLDGEGGADGSARGDPDMWTGLFGRSSRLTRLFPRSRLARRNVRDAELAMAGRDVEVDWLSGACMLTRRSAFEAVGGFDERFFLYWEDADLCRRLRSAGWTVRYAPDARVRHAGGGLRHKAARAAVLAFHDSAFLYYVTHVAPGRWNPKRWLAWALLRARCAWKLATLR